jgi:hypothetical protein
MVQEMRNKLLITVGNETAEAELLWSDAPNICKKLWENLPIRARGTHAKVCNHELMFMLPFPMARENLQQVTPGAVGWWDAQFVVNLWYDDPGPNGPLGPTALFAVVTKNLEGIGREIKKTWIKPGIEILLEKGTK